MFVPTCVLQVLLGGGDSFSAGGPGKGMYSRLYREVLNRHFWVESAEAFTSMHTESGLLGIAGAAQPPDAGKLMHVFCTHFGKVRDHPRTCHALGTN
jgi:mitochondrial-processing peptidase subunit alpha